MKSRSNHGTIDALPGERESERLLRLIKIAMADFRTTVEKSVGTFRQHFAHIQASLNYIGQSNQAAFAALHKITAPRLHLPEVKLPDLSGQIASVAQAMAPIRRQQVEFVDLWRGITEQLRPATEKFIESIRDFHKGFQARLEHYPKLSENIVPLAQRGWFVSEYFDIDELDLLAQAAASSLDELEQCIAKLYKENFVTHLQSIIRDYPERDFILRPAGDAHLRGEYGLSITAFFSQIDGICFDAYEKYIFFRTGTDEHMSSLAALRLETVTQGDDNNPFGQFLNLRHEIMWRSISEKLPIGYSVKERKNFGYTGINRHTVLHGTATKDYATKENSLSAFSFLSYIASLAKMDSIRNWSKETE